MSRKVYIAGPMTGIPSFNIPAFDEAAANLRGRQIDAVSPAELDEPEVRAISLASPDGSIATLNSHGKTWGDFLARDVKLISDGGFDAIVVLDGWAKSRGARLETFVGSRMVGLPVICYVCDDEVPLATLVAAWAGSNLADVFNLNDLARAHA